MEDLSDRKGKSFPMPLMTGASLAGKTGLPKGCSYLEFGSRGQGSGEVIIVTLKSPRSRSRDFDASLGRPPLFSEDILLGG